MRLRVPTVVVNIAHLQKQFRGTTRPTRARDLWTAADKDPVARRTPGRQEVSSLTIHMTAWRRSRWHRKSSRQSQAEADGVTPAGFFCIRHRATLGRPVRWPGSPANDSPENSDSRATS